MKVRNLAQIIIHLEIGLEVLASELVNFIDIWIYNSWALLSSFNYQL